MRRLSDAELLATVLDGLAPEIELFGSASDAGEFLRFPGLVASISPQTPDRSIFNSVFALDPDALPGLIDELEARYELAGVRAWTVWVRESDRAGAELLAGRGHVLDGAPRAMALELDELVEPSRPLPGGVELRPGDIAAAGAINDVAYGIEGPAWSAAMTRAPSLPVRWAVASWAGEPVACAAAMRHGDDAAVTAVATLPERRGHGLAGHVVHALMSEAAAAGARTGSLQASAAGAPVYERLGFRDVGHVELWEKRRS